MTLLAATSLAAAAALSGPVAPQCSWDRPGANAFHGDVVAAVDRYLDIPPAARAALKARMAKRQYDDLAVITRDTIRGRHEYDNLRDMHFGAGTICRTITRTKWEARAQERGLVYCEGEHCLIVPTVCRNVSRVTRRPGTAAAAPTAAAPGAPAAGGPAATEPTVVAMTGALPAGPAAAATATELAVASGDGALRGTAPAGELQFEAPGAGPSFSASASPAAAPATAGAAGETSVQGTFAGGGAPQAPVVWIGGWAGWADPGRVGGTGTTIPTEVPGSSTPTPDLNVPVVPPTTPPGGNPGPIGPVLPPGGLPDLPPVLPEGPVTAIPEPGATWLMLAGLAGLGAWTRRRRRAV